MPFFSTAPLCTVRKPRLSAITVAITVALTSVTAQASEPEQPAILKTVKVSADASADGLPAPYAGNQVARGGRIGLLGNQDRMETPFSVTSYTQELIQDQQARSVADVLQNDPGVRMARGFGNFQEVYMVRGFALYSDDIAYNGLYGLLPRQYVAAELLERVEVFRGANTFLNGAAPGGSGLGGAVNLLPKRAPNDPLTRITAGIESGGQGYAAIDVARRFGAEQSTGVRFNAVRRDGENAIDDEDHELSVLALGIDFHRDDLRVSGDIGHQDRHVDAPRPNVTPGGGIPDEPDAENNFAQHWTYSDERQTFGTVRAEYDFGDHATAWAAVGMRRGEEENVLANPTVTPDGASSANRFDNVREDRVRTGEIGLRTQFETGGISHSLSVAANSYALDSRNAFAFYTGFNNDLYNPFPAAPPVLNLFPGGSLASPGTTQEVETSSIAIADTLATAGGRVLFTVGLRHQTIEDRTFDYNSGADGDDYDESRITPVGGVVVRATERVSLYANYIEGLIKGDTFSPDSVSGRPGKTFEPYQTKQIELGMKYDGGNIGGDFSAFTSSKPSAYLVGNTYEEDGEQRNRGVELTFFGEPVAGVRVLGGITLQDITQRETADGLYDGNDVIATPEQQGNIGVEWDLPGVAGLTVTGRVVHTGDQYVDQANALQIDAWTRVDLGARYLMPIGDRVLTLRGRVDNVANEDYWASAGGYPGAGYLVLGSPRTVAVSASVDF